MTNIKNESPDLDYFDPENYQIESFEDELRVDNNSKVLLKKFHLYLLNNKDTPPLEAGSMASGADYFLRDYMIDNRQINIFAITVDLIHSFAGNWYIVSTLEPNMAELESFLIGISNFYIFCSEHKLIEPPLAEQIGQACADLDLYRQRIDSFNNIVGDGFIEWNKTCLLP